MAQVQPLTKAILVGLEATPSGGPPWIQITNTDAVDTAFVDALASFPAQGGTLYVMPSDGSPYRFAATVPVTKPNVTIEFLGGSELAFATASPGPQSAFLVMRRTSSVGERAPCSRSRRPTTQRSDLSSESKLTRPS